MGIYINDKGEAVSIEHNGDGSFTVTVAGGEGTTYGENVSTNMYHDYGLEGQDLSVDGVPPDPDAPA